MRPGCVLIKLRYLACMRPKMCQLADITRKTLGVYCVLLLLWVRKVPRFVLCPLHGQGSRQRLLREVEAGADQSGRWHTVACSLHGGVGLRSDKASVRVREPVAQPQPRYDMSGASANGKC